eukprot:TRINITY_DN6203_c0_g2_i1.p1 TRINITY_DN6203_c0_g2~~TRINITY_DN6203_c0_g2_i1.p1  ORF type:complete len:469 (+),score=84.19 TRINITY_DN6203_c0_g2_i1:71-1477(+)
MQPTVQQQRRAGTRQQPMRIVQWGVSQSSVDNRPFCGGMVQPIALGGSRRSSRPMWPVTSRKPQTKAISRELGEFLRRVGLTQYIPALLSHGFDDMETILLLDEKHMRDLGMGPDQIWKMKQSLAALARRPVATARQIREEEKDEEKDEEGILPAPAESTIPLAPDPLPAGQAGLSAQTVDSVKRSWVAVESLGSEVVAELFYKNLFEVAPTTKELFPIAVRNRHRDWACDEEEDEDDPVNSPALRKLFAKVLDAVGTAVAGLQDITSLVPHLTALGMRHINYNTTDEHFAYGGQALLITLQAGLGELYTPDVEAAWKLVYDFVSATIIAGLKMAREKQEEINFILTKKDDLGRSHRPGSSRASFSTVDDLDRIGDSQALTECSWTPDPQPKADEKATQVCSVRPGCLGLAASKAASSAVTIRSETKTKTISCFEAPMLPRLLHSMCQGLTKNAEAKPRRWNVKGLNA